MSAVLVSPSHRAAGRPAQIATRLIFLVAGIAAAAWAPLVPFARARIGTIDDGVSAMLATGVVGPLAASCAVSAVLVAVITVAFPALLNSGDGGEAKQPLFVLPPGVDRFCRHPVPAGLLKEGAMQDCSAVFLTTLRDAEAPVAGTAFAFFAATMTLHTNSFGIPVLAGFSIESLSHGEIYNRESASNLYEPLSVISHMQ